LEDDEGGWQGDGFVRLENSLPQTYSVRMITMESHPTVQNVDLDANNSAEVEFTIDGKVDRVVLVISGTTPVTREKHLIK